MFERRALQPDALLIVTGERRRAPAKRDPVLREKDAHPWLLGPSRRVRSAHRGDVGLLPPAPETAAPEREECQSPSRPHSTLQRAGANATIPPLRMPLTTGTRLGPYEVVAKLGEGLSTSLGGIA